jgi:hypothetical protein
MEVPGHGLLVPGGHPEEVGVLKQCFEGAVLGLRMRQYISAKAALILGVIAWFLSGCAPWVQVGGPYRGSLASEPVNPPSVGGYQGYQPEPVDRSEFQVTLPEGWRRADFVQDALLLTRDGVSLQYIRISLVAIGDALPNTKKKLAKGMSPQDVATLELEEVRSDQTLRNFAEMENTSFQVADLPGFKLVYTFRAENGLRLKRVHYGVLVRDWVYRVQYQAPVRHYFDKDLATFERVRETFRITSKP